MNWNGSQLLKQTKYAKHKGITEAYISAWIKRDEVSLIKWKLDLRSMEWAKRFSLGGFTVTYSTFQMAWEVLEKKEGIKLPSGGSTNGSRLKIFTMDGLVENSTVFSFLHN